MTFFTRTTNAPKPSSSLAETIVTTCSSAKSTRDPYQILEYARLNLEFCRDNNYEIRKRVFSLNGYRSFINDFNNDFRALRDLVKPNNTIADKYASLEKSSLENILRAENILDIEQLLLENFDSSLSADTIHTLKTYLDQKESSETAIALSSYFNTDKIFTDKAISLCNIADIGMMTTDNIHAVIKITAWMSRGISGEKILQAAALMNVHSLLDIKDADVAAIEFLLQATDNKLNIISAKILDYRAQKSILGQDDLLEINDDVLQIVKSRPFVMDSFFVNNVINMVKVAIRYGISDLQGIRLQRGFHNNDLSNVSFNKYKKLADAISYLKVTPLALAKRMIETASNGNTFGHLDLFALGMLNAFEMHPEQDELAQSIFPEIVHDVNTIYASELMTLLKNVKLYAEIIDYTSLKDALSDIPSIPETTSQEVIDDYVIELNNLRLKCIAMGKDSSTSKICSSNLSDNAAEDNFSDGSLVLPPIKGASSKF